MFSLLLALTIATAASPQNPAASPTENKQPTPVEKPICRRDTPTGSNFPVRTCHSKSEWQAIDAANQAGAEATLRNRSVH